MVLVNLGSQQYREIFDNNEDDNIMVILTNRYKDIKNG